MFYTYYKKRGNNILIRYKDKSGKTKSKVFPDYQPTLYIATNESSDIKSIYDDNLKPFHFDDIKSASAFLKDSILPVHGNSEFDNQFIIELCDGHIPEYNPSHIKVGIFDIEVDVPVGGEFPDATKAIYPINAITIYNSTQEKFFTYFLALDSNFKWDRKYISDDLNVELFVFYNEFDLLKSFVEHIKSEDYDILSGWNSETFDIPYIITRCNQILSTSYTKTLSPFKSISSRSFVNSFGKEEFSYSIDGISQLDYLDVYKKFTMTNRPNYKLDTIAEIELGIKKVSYSEHKSLSVLYRDDPSKFIDYNIQDVDIIRRLDNKLGMLNLIYSISYYSLSNYNDTLGTVRLWEKLIAKFLYNKGKAPLAKRSGNVGGDFEGAYVREPVVGKHEWLICYDLNSLYPHCEMQWDIGIDTLVKDVPDDLLKMVEGKSFDDLVNGDIDLSLLNSYDMTMTPNFQFYRKDKKSFMAEIKESLYNERKVYKKKMLDAKKSKESARDESEYKSFSNQVSINDCFQLGLKTLLNSGYGALGNDSFLYYNLANAEAVTSSGKLVNIWTSGRLEKFLQNILDTDEIMWVYSDTDSCYITLKEFVKTLKGNKSNDEICDIIDSFGKDIIEPQIVEYCNNLCEYMNCYEQKMVWAREVISDKAIWIAKKKYVMSVLDNEGVRYKSPNYKVVGLEAIKEGSYPRWARDLLLDCYKIALNQSNDDLIEFLSKARSVFDEMGVSDIAIPTAVNGLDKYSYDDGVFTSGSPKHVKGALAHNYLIDKHEIKNVEKIKNGNKILYVELKKPNRLGFDVISFDSHLPDFLIDIYDVEKCIDRDVVFQKSFLSPLDIFLNAIGWKQEKVVDLFG